MKKNQQIKEKKTNEPEGEDKKEDGKTEKKMEIEEREAQKGRGKQKKKIRNCVNKQGTYGK